jgi:hypothetical protein
MSKFDVSNLNFKSVKNLITKDKSLPNLKKLEYNKDHQSLTVPNDNNHQDNNNNKQLHNNQYYSGLNRNIPKKNFHHSHDAVSRKKGKSLSQHNINSISNNETTSFNINLVRENSKDEIIPNFGSYSSTSSYKLNQTTKENVPIVSTQNKFLHDFDEELSMLPRENSQPNTYKIIVKNLENELREKKDEIKTLKKNFREKILILEQENKLNLDMVENQHKIEVSALLKNHEIIVKELHEENDLLIEKFENVILKLANEKNQNIKNCMDKNKHEEKIRELSKAYDDKYEELKKGYDENIKQMNNLFENPLYVNCLEKIRYYNINKEKLQQVADVKLINHEENKSELEYEVGDVYSIIDSIKFEQLKNCTLYFQQLNEINYKCQNILNRNNVETKNKLADLREEVYKRFSEIESLSIHKDDPNKYEIKQIRKELNLKINNIFKSKPIEDNLKNEETKLEFDKGN